MPTIFSECGSEVSDMAAKVMQKYHPDLVEADVTIAYLFADNPDGPALKVGGYVAAATVKINSYANRVEGMSDATIKISKSWWDEHSEEEQLALIDHELFHLAIKRDEAGGVVTDDINRPKLKMRLHDWSIGGFDAIVKRHGFNAEECKSILGVRGKWIQDGFDFGEQPGDDRFVGDADFFSKVGSNHKDASSL